MLHQVHRQYRALAPELPVSLAQGLRTQMMKSARPLIRSREEAEMTNY